MSIPPLDQQICFALYSASHAMTRLYKPMLDGLGLTYPQYLVLNLLWADEASEDRPADGQVAGQTVGQLGQQLRLESNTLTPLLKRMEAAGLILRSRSPQDERQVIVTLTAAGQALRARAEPIPACIFQAAGLSVEALTTLQGQITALRDRLVTADSPDPASGQGENAMQGDAA